MECLDLMPFVFTRAQFEENLHNKVRDPLFCQDMNILLHADVHYDIGKAHQFVHDNLIDNLPGEPWLGRVETQ